MKRIVGVVFAFVVLNTLGFVVYRAISTTDAAASNLVDSAPPTSATLARVPVASQPKPTPPIAAPVDDKPIVSEPTPAAAVEVQAPPPHASSAQRTRAIPKPILQKHVDQTPPVAPIGSAKPTTEAKPAPAAEPKPADPLQMEANPYKRGE